jgi:hypothetical protein
MNHNESDREFKNSDFKPDIMIDVPQDGDYTEIPACDPKRQRRRSRSHGPYQHDMPRNDGIIPLGWTRNVFSRLSRKELRIARMKFHDLAEWTL